MARSSPTRANPFVPVVDAPDTSDVLEQDELFGAAFEMAGPPVPPGTRSPVPRVLPRDLVNDRQLPPNQQVVFVVGLHGGSGATTVSRLLGRRYWASPARVVPSRSTGECNILFVARSSGVGIEQAVQAGQEWGAEHWPDLARVGLLLVADGPKTASPLRTPAKHAARLFPRTWRLSWVPSWHVTGTPDLTKLPPSAKMVASRIEKYYFGNS